MSEKPHDAAEWLRALQPGSLTGVYPPNALAEAGSFIINGNPSPLPSTNRALGSSTSVLGVGFLPQTMITQSVMSAQSPEEMTALYDMVDQQVADALQTLSEERRRRWERLSLSTTNRHEAPEAVISSSAIQPPSNPSRICGISSTSSQASGPLLDEGEYARALANPDAYASSLREKSVTDVASDNIEATRGSAVDEPALLPVRAIPLTAATNTYTRTQTPPRPLNATDPASTQSPPSPQRSPSASSTRAPTHSRPPPRHSRADAKYPSKLPSATQLHHKSHAPASSPAQPRETATGAAGAPGPRAQASPEHAPARSRPPSATHHASTHVRAPAPSPTAAGAGVVRRERLQREVAAAAERLGVGVGVGARDPRAEDSAVDAGGERARRHVASSVVRDSPPRSTHTSASGSVGTGTSTSMSTGTTAGASAGAGPGVSGERRERSTAINTSAASAARRLGRAAPAATGSDSADDRAERSRRPGAAASVDADASTGMGTGAGTGTGNARLDGAYSRLMAQHARDGRFSDGLDRQMCSGASPTAKGGTAQPQAHPNATTSSASTRRPRPASGKENRKDEDVSPPVGVPSHPRATVLPRSRPASAYELHATHATHARTAVSGPVARADGPYAHPPPTTQQQPQPQSQAHTLAQPPPQWVPNYGFYSSGEYSADLDGRPAAPTHAPATPAVPASAAASTSASAAAASASSSAPAPAYEHPTRKEATPEAVATRPRSPESMSAGAVAPEADASNAATSDSVDSAPTRARTRSGDMRARFEQWQRDRLKDFVPPSPPSPPSPRTPARTLSPRQGPLPSRPHSPTDAHAQAHTDAPGTHSAAQSRQRADAGMPSRTGKTPYTHTQSHTRPPSARPRPTTAGAAGRAQPGSSSPGLNDAAAAAQFARKNKQTFAAGMGAGLGAAPRAAPTGERGRKGAPPHAFPRYCDMDVDRDGTEDGYPKFEDLLAAHARRRAAARGEADPRERGAAGSEPKPRGKDGRRQGAGKAPREEEGALVRRLRASRLREQFEAHERAWTTFEQQWGRRGGPSPNMNDVPWPHDQHDLVCEGWDEAALRAHMRVLFLRWHPDKWQQRFGAVGEDVLGRVTTVIQLISSLKQ